MLRWRCGGYGETAMRRLLHKEAYSTLPLPDPKTVVASRLPASERLMAKPPEREPEEKWPSVVTSGARAGVALVLPKDAPPLKDSDAISPRVSIVRIDKASGGALAETLSAPIPSGALLDLGERTPVLWKPLTDPRIGEWALGLGDWRLLVAFMTEERDVAEKEEATVILRGLGIPLSGQGNAGGSSVSVLAGDYWIARRALEAHPKMSRHFVEDAGPTTPR
jgi:hypothetical protein